MEKAMETAERADEPRRKRTVGDLREELAAATAALKEQKWVKMLSQRMGGEAAAVAAEQSADKDTDAATAAASTDGAAECDITEATLEDAEQIPVDRNELDDFLQTEISAVDITKDAIVAHLADEVRKNHDTFIMGMKQVQDVDLDLAHAQIHVKNGRRLLASTKNDLVRSSLEIVKMKRNHDRVAAIVDLGSHVLRVFEEESKMTEAVHQHAFTNAVEICLGLRCDVADESLERLSILDKLSCRVKNFLPELRDQFDKSLRAVAENFDPVRYKELLQAYITLADHAETLGFEFSQQDLNDVLSSIPEVMVRCIHDLAHQCLADLCGPRSSSRRTSTRRGATRVSVEPDALLVVECAQQTTKQIRSAFARLTDLMHTYYLLAQWHRDPFSPRNDDIAYLHRCGIDDDDDDDDDDDEDEENDESNAISPPSSIRSPRMFSSRNRKGSDVSSESSPPSRSPYSRILCETGMTMVRYRKIVWENMQRSVMEMLARVDVANGFKLEHIIALSQSTSTFIDIGEEFTGTPSSRLRSMLRVKCEQYLSAFHEDNLELLRMLFEADTWQRILSPGSDLSDAASILELVEKRSGYKCARHACPCPANPIYSRNVFPSFHIAGNPLRSRDTGDQPSLAGDDGLSSNKSAKKLAADENPEGSNSRTDAIALAAAEDADPMDELVLTSSTLSGFVRLCGVYLKMMHHLPHIAWDIFGLLIKLFEFHLYAVMTSFADAQALIRLFRPSPLGLPQWQTLQSAISRIAQDFSSGEVLLRVMTPSPEGLQQQVALRRVTSVPLAMEQATESNLNAFVERTVAVETVVSQCRMLNAMKPLVLAELAERYQCLVDEVYERSMTATKELKHLIYNSIAHGVVEPSSVSASILRVRWDIPFVSDKHNPYVVGLVRRCGELWGAMQVYSDGAVPGCAREDMWAMVVQHVMDTVLLALSSVTSCTAQGRALMSMDLLALQNGLDLIHHVSHHRVPRDFQYVNDYIKAFYLTEDDLLEWIRANKRAYSNVLLVNLIRNGVGGKLSKPELSELVLRIDTVLHSDN